MEIYNPDKHSLRIKIKCKKSLFKSTYGKNAFTKNRYYYIVKKDDRSIIGILDNNDTVFTFAPTGLCGHPYDVMYKFDEYFTEVK